MIEIKDLTMLYKNGKGVSDINLTIKSGEVKGLLGPNGVGKSTIFNIIKLNNGQFAAQPNNRIRWYEQSLIPEKTEKPDFNVCTKDYSVETGDKWSVGDTTEYFYKSKEVWK